MKLIVFCALLSVAFAVSSHYNHRSHKVHHSKPNIVSHHIAKKQHETKNEEHILKHLEDSLKVKKPHAKADEICSTPECLQSSQEIQDNMDSSTDPCVDFNRFACGGYYDSHVPVDGSQGMFYDADDLTNARLNLLLHTDAKPGDTRPVKDTRVHFSTCLDTDQIDSVGLTSLWNHLNAHGQAGWPIAMDNFDPSSFELYGALNHVQAIGLNPFIAIGLASDFLETSYNILYVAEGTLGMSSTYLLDPDSYPDEIAAYTTYIAESAKLVRDYIGSSKSDAQIDSEAVGIVNFEMAVAESYTFFVRNRTDVLDKTDVAYLQVVTDDGVPGQFDWLTYFAAMFKDNSVVIDDTEPVYIYGEPYFSKFSTLLSTADSTTLSNYIGWRLVMETSLATTYAMRNLTLDYDNAIFGTTSFRNREDHCTIQTQFDYKMQVTRAYVDDYFSPSSKTQVEQLVAFMKDAFQSLLDENDWMDPSDIPVAKEKLDSIISRVAYPGWIMNDAELELAYQGLNIVQGDHFNNLMRIGNYLNYWNLEVFRNDPNIGWFLPPTTVNAFYDPLTNSITILAGIIQYPFYVQGSLAAVNYGGIGMVIGHEMTHGFDDSGRHFDKDGNLANWWSQSSIDGFKNKSQCFVDQYDAYSPPEFAGTQYANDSVDGQNTLGENIADNGGIREAFRAYTSYVQQFGPEARLAGLEQYSPEQLFYLGFANVWCERKTADSLHSQILFDVHSPGQFRILGPLSNDANFWNTWNCSAGTAMNRGVDACVLW